jgi:glycosyltransferase involved in cell wall biosynthesis
VIRVLHLITSFGLGGAETTLAQLVGRMDRSRFANSVVVMLRLPALRPRVAMQKIPLHCLEMRPGVPNPVAAARFLRIVRSERPQVLQTWMYHADLLGLAVGRLARVPKISWNIRRSFIDMQEHRLLSGWVLQLLVKLSGIPDAVLTNSVSGRRTHETLGYTPRRWVCIPNCIDCDRFRPAPDERTRLRNELRLPSDTPLVALVARHVPIKGHDVFIAAAGKLAAVNPSVHFVLAGRQIDGTNTLLMRSISSSGVPERFHLLGERDDIERVFAAVDIACSSSYGEGFPNVVAEAMACGTPCVVTNAGDSALVVGSFGQVVPIGDPAALSSSFEQLLMSSHAERQKLGRCARRRIERRFSVASMVARYEQFYEELASPGIGRSESA